MIALPVLPKQGLHIVFLLVLGSTCTASLVPAMGYFIVEGLQQPPWKIGLYTGLVTPLTMLVNRRFGRLLDGSVPVRKLLGLSVGCFVLFAGLLASGPRFEVLVLAGAPMMAIANGATATTFTFGRLYANARDINAGRFNALLRMGVSLAWMIGPALTFVLIAEIGFQKTYFLSAALGLVWLTSWHFLVPGGFTAPPKTRKDEPAKSMDWALLLAALSCTMFALANVLFTTAAPLFFIKEAGLPGFTPGMTLSIKCFFEILVIFAAARLAERFGARQILLVAALLGVFAFGFMAQVTTVAEAAAYAALEGLYYGLFAGIAITYVQSFIPEEPGKATAIYMNSLFLGGMIGGVSMGFIADAFDFQMVVYAAGGVGALAFVLLILTKRTGRHVS
ncbi:MFS transporter [Roseibium polysiphoniae]|uniref:MFS transporter n=1 Tax=Roseibium polysiphoniae TaxID=2571221 RepID=UPI003298CEA8